MHCLSSGKKRNWYCHLYTIWVEIVVGVNHSCTSTIMQIQCCSPPLKILWDGYIIAPRIALQRHFRLQTFVLFRRVFKIFSHFWHYFAMKPRNVSTILKKTSQNNLNMPFNETFKEKIYTRQSFNKHKTLFKFIIKKNTSI